MCCSFFLLRFLWLPLRLIAFCIWINEFFISTHTQTHTGTHRRRPQLLTYAVPHPQISFILFHFVAFFSTLQTDNRIKTKNRRQPQRFLFLFLLFISLDLFARFFFFVDFSPQLPIFNFICGCRWGKCKEQKSEREGYSGCSYCWHMPIETVAITRFFKSP